MSDYRIELSVGVSIVVDEEQLREIDEAYDDPAMMAWDELHVRCEIGQVSDLFLIDADWKEEGR